MVEVRNIYLTANVMQNTPVKNTMEVVNLYNVPWLNNSMSYVYEEIVNDAMGIFQQTYPYTVKIDYDNSHTREIEQVDISKIAENRSFEDLISDFYRQMYSCEISEEEMDIMRIVAREAGVLYEAD